MHIKNLHPDSLKISRYLYERSDFTSASPLLDIAKEYSEENPEGAEVTLTDIYGALASRDSESNNLEAALHNFQLQWEYLQKAFEKGLLERGKSLAALAREGLSLGGLWEWLCRCQTIFKSRGILLTVFRSLEASPK